MNYSYDRMKKAGEDWIVSDKVEDFARAVAKAIHQAGGDDVRIQTNKVMVGGFPLGPGIIAQGLELRFYEGEYQGDLIVDARLGGRPLPIGEGGLDWDAAEVANEVRLSIKWLIKK